MRKLYAETLFFFIKKNQNIKKDTLANRPVSKMADVFSTALTAQKQKVTRIFWGFIVLGIITLDYIWKIFFCISFLGLNIWLGFCLFSRQRRQSDTFIDKESQIEFSSRNLTLLAVSFSWKKAWKLQISLSSCISFYAIFLGFLYFFSNKPRIQIFFLEVDDILKIGALFFKKLLSGFCDEQF